MGGEWLGRILLALLGLAFAVGAAELLAGAAPGVWVHGAERSPHALERLQDSERRLLEERFGRASVYKQIDGTRIWRVGAPKLRYRNLGLDHDVVVAYNRLGLRDRDPAEGAGRPTWLLLGDSFVEARELPLSQTVARVLERRLEGDVRVVNAGIGATGTTNQLHLLEWLLPQYRPSRVVLFFFVGNDFVNNSLPFQSLHRAFRATLDEAQGVIKGPSRDGKRRTRRAHYRTREDGSRYFVPRDERLEEVLAPQELERFEAALATRREAVDRCLAELAPWRRFEAAASHLVPDAVSLVGWRLGLRPELRCAPRLEGAPAQLWMESAAVRDRHRDWWDEAWDVSVFLLDAARHAAERGGAELHVVILPPAADLDPALRAQLLRRQGGGALETVEEPPAETLARRLAEAGIPALDLGPALRAHPDVASLYLPVDPHLSAAGHVWLAEQLEPLW